eukprot:6490284-Amphidinium_carterae.3
MNFEYPSKVRISAKIVSLHACTVPLDCGTSANTKLVHLSRTTSIGEQPSCSASASVASALPDRKQ